MNHPSNYHMVALRQTDSGAAIEVSEVTSFEDLANYVAVVSDLVSRPALYPIQRFTAEQAIADYQVWYC